MMLNYINYRGGKTDHKHKRVSMAFRGNGLNIKSY